VVFAPERARAALALIEQVTTADPGRPLASASTSAPAVVPTGAATTQTALKLDSRNRAAPGAKTTLGAAASSVRVDATQPRSRPRALALGVLALALAGVVVVVLTTKSRDRSAPATPDQPRALRAPADAQLASPPEAASIAIGDAASDAGAVATSVAADAAIAATRPSPVDARPARHRKQPDAAVTTDAPTLEPARPDDEPLQPAR